MLPRVLVTAETKWITDESGRVYSIGAFSQLSAARYRVDGGAVLVVGRVAGAATEALIASDLMTDFLGFRRGRGSWAPNLRNLIRLFREVLSVSIVVIRVPGVIGGLVGLACLVSRRRFVAEILADVSTTATLSVSRPSFRRRIAGRLLHGLTAALVARAAAVRYVTKYYLQDRYPPSADADVLTGSDADLSIFRDVARRLPDVPRRGKSTCLRIGMSGSFAAPYKGHKVLLRALQISKDMGRDRLEVELTGPGAAEHIAREVEHLNLEDEVTILGSRSAGVSMANWMCSLDAYVQPSLSEGMPRAVLEAMACGVPALGSSAGGLNEILHVSARHSPGNVMQLAESLTRLRDPDWRASLADYGMRTSVRLYCCQVCFSRWLSRALETSP